MNLTGVQSLRPRLLASALDVLQEQGLDGVTMRAVADRAGVTAPALYWHFADKEALVRGVGREVARLYNDRMLEATRLPSSEARLRSALGVFRAFAIEHPAYFHMLFERPAAPKGGRRDAVDRAAGPPIFQYLIDRVAECMRDGSLARGDPESAAMTLAALAQGLIGLRGRGRLASDAAFAEFYDRSIERMIAGLR
jgi:AcrR family transcriptional regulator